MTDSCVTASAYHTPCAASTSARKSWFQPQICIFPRVLSLSGCRVSSVIANFRNQLRLFASVRSRVRLSSSRNVTSSVECVASIDQCPRTASAKRCPRGAMLAPLWSKHASTSPHYPSPLRVRNSFLHLSPASPSISTRIERLAVASAPRDPKNPRFYPRAKKSPSNFPRFGFSKRGFCAHATRKNTPQPDPRFPLAGAQSPRVFPPPPPQVRRRDSFFNPPKRGRNSKPTLITIRLR
jgi:hypothetical protein